MNNRHNRSTALFFKLNCLKNNGLKNYKCVQQKPFI